MTLFKRCACTKRCDHPYWYEFEIAGVRHRRSTKLTDKEKAESAAWKAKERAVTGEADVAPVPRLSEFVADYVEWAAGDHPASVAIDQRVLRTFVTFIGAQTPLDRITSFHVERWRSAQAKKIGRSTINRHTNVIRGLFSKAIEWKKLTASPLKAVAHYRTDDTRVRVLTAEEMKVVLTGGSPTLRLACRVTLECLPRLSEVLNLHRTDIGPTWIQIRRKGGRVDRVAITPELRAELWAQAHRAMSGFVFRQRHQGAVSAAFTNEFRGLGLEGVSHHTMRHTGVTLMLEAGVNPRVIQQLAGWSSLRMLARYGHVRDAESQRAVAANASVIAAALAESPQNPPHEGVEQPATATAPVDTTSGSAVG